MKATTEERGGACAARYRIGPAWLVMAGVGLHAGAPLAAPGDLDPAFGDNGRVVLSLDGGLDDWATGAGRPAIVRQPDGRVLVARTDHVGSTGADSEVAVVRLRTDGTLDTKFGESGVARLRFQDGKPAGASGMALLPDGRIVIVGYSVDAWIPGGLGDVANLNTGIALVRADGSLDPGGFGNGGRLAIDLSAAGRSDHALVTVAVENEHVVIAGSADGDTSTRVYMVRMALDGNLDRSFGASDGVTWIDSMSQLAGFHRSAGDRLVACGSRWVASEWEGRIARFDANGQPVGKTTGLGAVTACIPQEDGGLLVGEIEESSGTAWLARADADGQFDSSFGESSGRTAVTCSSCATWDPAGWHTPTPASLAVQTDGRLAVALHGFGVGQLSMLRFGPGARPDPALAEELADRYYDVGWREQPPAARASELLATEDGLLAVVASEAITTVMRFTTSAGPGASVIGLRADVTLSESETRGMQACRTGSADGVVSVGYATRDDTAQSPGDFTAVSGVLTWDDGQTGCQTVNVTASSDSLSESAETLWLKLTGPVGAGLAMDEARFYVVDKTTPPPPPPPPPPATGGNGGGGAGGSVLLAMLAALAGLRRTRRQKGDGVYR